MLVQMQGFWCRGPRGPAYYSRGGLAQILYVTCLVPGQVAVPYLCI